MFYKLHMRALFVLAVCVTAFAIQTNAQACGKYFITVSVQDMAGKPIANAEVKLSAITIDETKGKQFVRDPKDPLLYTIDFYEGTSFKEFHKLTVSALGYKTAENQVKFLSCDSRPILVNLAALDSSTSSAWHFKNTVDAEASGSDGKDIEGLKLTVTDEKNYIQSIDMKLWYAYFDLPNGKYTFRFDAPGYETKEEKVDLTAFARKTVKVELKPVKGPTPTNTQLTSRYCMTIRDEVGATISNSLIKFSPTKKSHSQVKYKFTGDSDGMIDVEILDGVYDIEVGAETFYKVVLKRQLLPYDPRSCTTVTLKTKISPHQIT